MSTSNNNYSILPWYDDQRYQNHRKTYAYGQVFPLIAKRNLLPCFQVVRFDQLMAPITEFILIALEDGSEYDITADILGSGLQVQSFSPADGDPYDLIVYPGTTAMGALNMLEGMFEARMSDGSNTWYSERWCCKNDVSKYIKLSYWHDVPFQVPLHHISYVEPFYSFVYLDSLINKPEYFEQQEVEERDGYVFPIYQISKKTFRIVGLALPEYLCDALRLVWMHHYVEIYYDGIKYTVDDIRVIFGDWVSQGHLCGVSIEFHTDTVVTQTGFIKDENDGGDYNQADYNDDFLIT